MLKINSIIKLLLAKVGEGGRAEILTFLMLMLFVKCRFTHLLTNNKYILFSYIELKNLMFYQQLCFKVRKEWLFIIE